MLDEIGDELGSTEIAPLELTVRLVWSRKELLSLSEDGERFTGKIELPEHEGEVLRVLRTVVRREEQPGV